MVKIDASGLVKSLEEFQKEAKRKLEQMTKEFCLSVIEKAAYNTPLGDASLYPGMYQMRYSATGLEPREGLARYGWDVAVDSYTDENGNVGYARFAITSSGVYILPSLPITIN